MQGQSGCPRDSQLLPHAQPSGSTSCSHLQPRHYPKTTLYYSQLATPAIAAVGHSSKVIQPPPPQVSIPRSSPRVRPSVNNALEARTSGPSLPSTSLPQPRPSSLASNSAPDPSSLHVWSLVLCSHVCRFTHHLRRTSVLLAHHFRCPSAVRLQPSSTARRAPLASAPRRARGPVRRRPRAPDEPARERAPLPVPEWSCAQPSGGHGRG